MTTQNQKFRELEIKLELERIYRAKGLETNKIDFLMQGVTDTSSSSAARAYVLGTEDNFDAVEVAEQILTSDRGQLVSNAIEMRNEADALDEELDNLQSLPPSARIAAARELGICQ